MTAVKTAQAAADAAFDAYLARTRATATRYVPQEVVRAAKDAYDLAGGIGEIEVAGHGNVTHPVCGVTVRRIRRNKAAR